MQIQRQFHDAMIQEQESKQRQTKIHGERLKKYEDDLKQQSDRLIEQHTKDDQSYQNQINRLRDEKATEQHKFTKLLQDLQKAKEETN